MCDTDRDAIKIHPDQAAKDKIMEEIRLTYQRNKSFDDTSSFTSATITTGRMKTGKKPLNVDLYTGDRNSF